jgi:hypothetical protein
MLLSMFAALPLFAQNFYEARFQSGLVDFNRGAYARAADELHVAAFGRLDDLPKYAIAEIYLTVADSKLVRLDDARVSALKVAQAEQISPVYSGLDLPASVRSQFEALLPTLLTRDQLVVVPAFARFASRATSAAPGAPLTTHQEIIVPTPTRRPNVAVTVTPNERNASPPQPVPAPVVAPAPVQPVPNTSTRPQTPPDYGRMALDRVAAGDEAGGRRNADMALAIDDSNANAHAALAQIGRSHNAWNDVAEHYAVVRTRRRLTDTEIGDYFVALVNTGRTADAMGVRRSLPASVLSRPDVRVAIQTIDPTPAPRTVTMQPSPTPAPAPRYVAPAPAPAPEPVAPAPSPVDSSSLTISEQIAASDRMLAAGNIVGARTELRRIAALPNVPRADRLALARTLSQTALYAESSAQYRKAYPLKAGEESHMFYEAVNRYELGDFGLARQLITRALPALPQTPAILSYRDRILAQQ